MPRKRQDPVIVATAGHIPATTRRIYRYSVIAGGAQSAGELRLALKRDPVAAEHWRGFQLSRIHVERLPQSRHVYVSYRINDRIYWTRKRVSLPRGETILTDGALMARTRCGNRISDSPMDSPGVAEPTEEILNESWSPSAEASAEFLAGSETSRLLGAERVGHVVEPAEDHFSAFGPQIVVSPGVEAKGEHLVGGGGAGKAVEGTGSPSLQPGPGSLLFPWLPLEVGSLPLHPPGRPGSLTIVANPDMFPTLPLVAAVRPRLTAVAFPSPGFLTAVVGAPARSIPEDEPRLKVATIPNPLNKEGAAVEVQAPEPKPVVVTLFGLVILAFTYAIRRTKEG